jgi:hypothetical protein
VGHDETISIVVEGLILFAVREEETRRQFLKRITASVISMSGMRAYPYFELKIKAASAAAPP